MRTDRFSDSGGGPYRESTWTKHPPGRDPPWTETPRQRPPGQRHPSPGQRPPLPRRNLGPGSETPRRNMGPGSQTGSDIIQRPEPPNRLTDASDNITLPQTSFAGGKKKRTVIYIYIFICFNICLDCDGIGDGEPTMFL